MYVPILTYTYWQHQHSMLPIKLLGNELGIDVQTGSNPCFSWSNDYDGGHKAAICRLR